MITPQNIRARLGCSVFEARHVAQALHNYTLAIRYTAADPGGTPFLVRRIYRDALTASVRSALIDAPVPVDIQTGQPIPVPWEREAAELAAQALEDGA